MTRPLDVHEQKQVDWFKPRHKILITFGMSKFDECWKIDIKKKTATKEQQGRFVQAMGNLPTVEDDINAFRGCLAKYRVQEWDELKLKLNPSRQDVEAVMKKLRAMIAEGQEARPPVNYLVIFLFAGHGMIKEGA